MPVAHIMINKKLSRYLRLHEITIRKYAAEGKIPAMRVGHVWRFDKDVIDDWIRTGQNETKADGRSKRKCTRKKSKYIVSIY
jgi:excisionase family DNA binding protein